MLHQSISKRVTIINDEVIKDYNKIKKNDTDEDSLDDFFAEEDESNNKTSWSDGGEVVAACIIAAANLLEYRLANSVEKTKKDLEIKSQKVISKVSPSKSKNRGRGMHQVVQVDSQIEALLTDDSIELYDYYDNNNSHGINKKGAKLVIYSDKAKRASEKLKENTKKITTGIRGTTTEAIIMISERADEVDVAGKICSNEGKEIFDATGKVAISGLGAASQLLDALYLGTKEVAKKSCEVTADVARHRYGEDAGKLVEDTGIAVGNTLRTFHLISQISGSNFAKTIGRDTGKAKLNRKQSNGSADSATNASSYNIKSSNDSLTSEQYKNRKQKNSNGKSRSPHKKDKNKNNGSSRSMDASISTMSEKKSTSSSSRKVNSPVSLNKRKGKRKKHNTYDI